jgi:hypothetical protein
VSLLVGASGIRVRGSIAAGPLAPLAAGLRAELAPVLEGRVELPRDKALLSRTGGRCPRDGTLLAFDPLDPRHRCARCGLEVAGEFHDRFRPYWYQLWLAERALHAAVLGVLLDDQACIDASAALLDAYAERYLQYPNADNVLGPSRPFFSTYLESIWLLQLTLALDLLESGAGGPRMGALGARVRDRLIEPSVALIASYDEGSSNRQVWNDAALIAAGTLLGRATLVDRAIEGSSGILALLERSLLEDGSWYEGENYHLFAHRGLWYGVTMAERLGRDIPEKLGARFDAGFASPFRTLLPDLTYPSRRDSQYAVSVRQPRFAESCELGLARREDPRLLSMLARLYEPGVPRRDTGRAASTADVERNLPATGLTRADLSWRSLLFARAELPSLVAIPMTSDLLPGQGLGIIRRDEARVFVALDYGHPGGGHGHPDRLNLLVSNGDTRWFDDPGTASYTDDSLHWYRSTLAHTAPLVDLRSQTRVHGALEAFEDAPVAGWIRASAPLAPGLAVRRTVVVFDGYLVDTVEWHANEGSHDVALPFHGVRAVRADGVEVAATPAVIDGGTGREDGFSFLRDTALLALPHDSPLEVESVRGDGDADRSLHGWLFLMPASTCWRAVAPGVPGRDPRPMVLARTSQRAGRIVGVWSWRGDVISAALQGEKVCVVLRSGEAHVHSPLADGWRVARRANGEERVLELGGAIARAPTVAESSAEASRGSHDDTTPHALPAHFELDERHYRRSEENWDSAGRPRASVTVESEPGRRTVRFVVDVPRSQRVFLDIDAENPFDNEPMAINGDGVQLYVIAGDQRGGWLLAPIADTTAVGIRPIDEWKGGLEVAASWTPRPHGYRLAAEVILPDPVTELWADVLVNEMTSDRARRRGQLVLSGADGEFVYLRGDRHEPERLLRFSPS